MRHYIWAGSAVLLLGAARLYGGITVEQIESYETDPGDTTNTRYAPIDFGGLPSVSLSSGQMGGFFDGITFHALGGTASTFSNHAYTVGQWYYGNLSPAYPFVSDVNNAALDGFFSATVNVQPGTGVAAAPALFASGAVVVNNSYVYSTGSTSSDLDAQRRLDFMIAQADVTFVAAAVSSSSGTNFAIPWSSYNSLAVTGSASTFSGTGSLGKQHADLAISGLASFSTATVAGYAGALYGSAQSNGQSDALHGVVIRSLLMAGADKAGYVRQTANNLDISTGAGTADYSNSLAMLNGGEQPLGTVGAAGLISTAPTFSPQGWAYGTVPAGTQQVLLFHADNPVTSVTASLNWDVTQTQPTAGQIDTSALGVQFPHVLLAVDPVTFSAGVYTLGTPLADATLSSASLNDNVQYLYSTSTLPAGDWAFVITGDAALPAAVGFSYSLGGVFSNQYRAGSGSWLTAGNWTGGVPNASGAAVTFSSTTANSNTDTVTVDSAVTVGRMTFSGSTDYVLAPGSAGVLTIDDSTSAAVNPLINVITGRHVVSVPIALAGGVTVQVAAAASLEIGSAVNGSGGIIKTGTGLLILDGSIQAGNLNISSGTVTLNTSADLNGSAVVMGPGSALNLPAFNSSGVSVRNLGSVLQLAAGSTVTLTAPASAADRQLLRVTGITLSGSSGNWGGAVNLTLNDLDLTSADVGVVDDQVRQGALSNGSNGIFSGYVNADASHLSAVAVMVNHDAQGNRIYGSGATMGLFDRADPAAADVLVKVTSYGDANMDGQVTAADFLLINNGYTQHLTGWYNGDFNGDGTIDGSDFSLIDNVFQSSAGNVLPAVYTARVDDAGITSVAPATVPEPAMIGMLAAGLLSVRRQRQHRG